jgi:S-adenosylmethionine synthetase
MEVTVNPSFLQGSESFGEGNSDKLCDFIVDALLDAFLEQQPNSQVHLDALAKSGLITIVGEVECESECCVDIE